MGRPNMNQIIEERRMRHEMETFTDDVFSDDDSFLQELENIPSKSLHQQNLSVKTAKVAINSNGLKVDTEPRQTEQRRHADVRLCCSPLLSPNEELTLLMVKNKPNSPDRNPDVETPPSPPRSYHKRGTHKVQSESSKLPLSQVKDNGNLEVRALQAPMGTTTFMDPRTGEVVYSALPTPLTSMVPPVHEKTDKNFTEILHVDQATLNSNSIPPVLASVTQESSESDEGATRQTDHKISSNDSGTTATPSTLVRRLNDADDDIHEYTTNYLPTRQMLEVIPSYGTENDSSTGASVESNTILEHLGVSAWAESSDPESDAAVNGRLPFSLHKGDFRGGSNMSNRAIGENITTDVNDESEHRRQVHRFPEHGVSSCVISSDETSHVEKYYHHKANRSWWKIYGVLCCLIIGIAVALSVYFATRQETNSLDGLSMNIDCNSAEKLTDSTGGVVRGEILPNIRGNLHVECQVEEDDGFALWYYVDGNGRRMTASTCSGTDISNASDTQVLVFAGSCGKLSCIGGSDQLCGSHGSVGWFAEINTRYYIVVKGLGTSNHGFFTLTLDTLSENDNCDGAMILDPLNNSPLVWSNRNATVDNAIPICDTNIEKAAASWFRLEGDGSVMCASISTDQSLKTDFPTTLSILEGVNCMELRCKETASPRDENPWITGGIAFVAEKGISYHVIIQSEQDELDGDFVLDLFATPLNGACERAVVVFPGSDPTNGTMINACNVKRTECQDFMDQPGVWYAVEGTGELMIVELTGLVCRDEFALQSQISVLKSGVDGCLDLQCVDFTSQECTQENDKVTSQWFSTRGEFYYLLVQSSDASDFTISIDEFKPLGSDNCVNASSLVINDGVSLGSTVYGKPADIGNCSNSGANGVWYIVEGTGNTFEASTCFPGTNYSTGITVLSGDCDGHECIPTKTLTCDGERSIAYWETMPGQLYFVYVHGQTYSDEGRFALELKEASLNVENDYCGSAEALSIPTTVYGSTEYATEDDEYARMCGNEAAAPGVWYAVLGQGKSISASLCGAGTQYDTQISVFAGSNCRALTCLRFNEDGCGIKSEVSWNAIEGQLYFILVSGFNNAVGDFELIVT